MKYIQYIVLCILIFIACHSNNKQGLKNEVSVIDSVENINNTEPNTSQNQLSILNLQESFETRNETQFLNQFPKKFDEFRIYFGWDVVNDTPQKLYNEANSYIDYWFDLIKKYKKHEKDIIRISKHGNWEPDAVNYLQDKTITYIKENKKYFLINELSSDEAQSILFFLFDGPHPAYDTKFASNLTSAKKKILDDLFEIGLFDGNENPDPGTDYTTSYVISDFENTEHFFMRDIDINDDGIPDKVVSADPYQGDELFLFINKDGVYKFVLKTINFSEDGGKQIVGIKKHEKGFVVITAFPDQGFLESYDYVSFQNDKWILTNTIYKTKSNDQEDAFIYVCDVKQNIDISSTNFWEDLKSMPEESQRDTVCTKINHTAIVD